MTVPKKQPRPYTMSHRVKRAYLRVKATLAKVAARVKR